MRKLLIAFLMFTSTQVFAGSYPQVTLNANVQLVKECKAADPFCITSTTVQFGVGDTITLYPQGISDSSSTCDQSTCGNTSTGKQPLANYYHYRGTLAKIVETDGLRAIAIISVDRYQTRVSRPVKKEVQYRYRITAEILNKDGILAKMHLSTDRIENLNSTTIIGKDLQSGGYSYFPELSISPSRIISQPSCPPGELCPTNPVPTPAPSCPQGSLCPTQPARSKDLQFNNEWQVIYGTIQD